MSDEEAFESAEEGETEKTASKVSAEKPTASGESSKSSSNVGTDKGGGKAKGKQQQQRKGKTKAQGKPAPDKKDKSGQKKPTVEKTKASSNPEGKGGKTDSDKNTKTETQPAPKSSKPVKTPESAKVGSATPDSATPDAAKPESANPQLEKSEKSKAQGGQQGSEPEQDPHKEAEKSKNGSEKPKEDQGDTSADSSETASKSASEIRQSLSSNTKDADAKNPADQSIPRGDSGDAAGDPRAEEGKQGASGGSGEGGGGWNWGWGSSLLNAATNSLETFSSQVGEGLTTIMDSVESSFGVPDPQDLAKADTATEPESKAKEAETVTVQPHEKEGSEEPPTDRKDTGTKGKDKKEKEASERRTEEEKEKIKAEGGEEENSEGGSEENAQQGSSWLSGWGMSSISNMGKSFVNKSQNLMNTGFEKAENLAAGGLDILETIGKKTYTTLTEHDPGLRRAREFLNPRKEKPSLSSMLKQAKDQAEEEVKHNEEMEEARKYNFTALFEDNQGLVHLEALEMLSNQSERKVQSLLSAMEEETLETLRLQLLEIKDIFQKACDAEEDKETSQEDTEQDFSKLVTENLSELHLGTAPDKLNQVQETVHQWIADFYSHEDHSEISDPKEIQQRAVQSLADVTSKAVEQFHKAGELVLLQNDEEKSCTHRAQSLAKLCSVLVTEIDVLANKFSQCLNKIGEEKKSTEEVSPMVTSVFLEASNASGYIQDAFQLLLPVLQHAAIQSAL